MAFKLVKQLKKVEWPVRIKVPTDGGKTEEHEFTGVFKLLPQTEYDENTKSKKSDAEFIGEILVGCKGLLDDDGEEIEFSPEVVAQLCEYPFTRIAIFKAYNEIVTGIEVKN